MEKVKFGTCGGKRGDPRGERYPLPALAIKQAIEQPMNPVGRMPLRIRSRLSCRSFPVLAEGFLPTPGGGRVVGRGHPTQSPLTCSNSAVDPCRAAGGGDHPLEGLQQRGVRLPRLRNAPLLQPQGDELWGGNEKEERKEERGWRGGGSPRFSMCCLKLGIDDTHTLGRVGVKVTELSAHAGVTPGTINAQSIRCTHCDW